MKRTYTALVKIPEEWEEEPMCFQVEANSPADAACKARLEAEFRTVGHRDARGHAEGWANMEYEILFLCRGIVKNLQKRKGKKL